MYFGRLYVTAPDSIFILPGERVETHTYWGDTVHVGSYTNPRVKFTVRDTNIIQMVGDSTQAIFRILDDNKRDIYIVAEYAGLKDSLHVMTVPNPSCGPWPDCYYNPRAIVMPELPRVYLDSMVAEARAQDTLLRIEAWIDSLGNITTTPPISANVTKKPPTKKKPLYNAQSDKLQIDHRRYSVETL